MSEESGNIVFNEEIMVFNRKLFICGKTINRLKEVCSEVYQIYADKPTSDQFEVMVKTCLDDRYFHLISFTHYPFKLVIGLFAKDLRYKSK